MSFLEHEFESLRRTRTELELRTEVDRFAKRMGFDNFVYVLNVSELLPSFDPVILHNYPSARGDRYLRGNYAQGDPLVRRGRHGSRPIIWTDYRTTEECAVLELWEETHEFGVAHGLSFAMHAKPGITGTFSLCRDQPIELERDAWFRLIGEVHSFAILLHELVCQRSSSRVPPLGEVELTRSQRAVMRWVVAGKTADEIGQIMSMTKHGVVFHINNVKASLKAKNTAQAVARAVTLGLL